MAEAKAGQQDAQQDEQRRAEGDGSRTAPKAKAARQKQQRQAERTYTQAELDRILGKVRKNARYLGRKEAEAELVARGATRQQAEQTVDRQQEQKRRSAQARGLRELRGLPRREGGLTGARREPRGAGSADKAARERVTEERQRVDREFAKHARRS
jgi:hypothetical protein